MIPSVWVEWVVHVVTLRRHHGLWDGLRLAHGCRSVPLGTLCDTMRWVCRLFGCKIGLGCRRSGRLRRYHPSGSVCTRRLSWALRAGEVLHLFAGSIRCSAVDVRTTVGLNRLGEVRVQTWMVGVQLAHIKSVGHRRGPSSVSSHSEQRHTNAGKNHGVVYLHGEELLAVR